MEKCNASLSRPWARSDSVGLLVTLASSVLLVTCAATLEVRLYDCCRDMGFETES